MKTILEEMEIYFKQQKCNRKNHEWELYESDVNMDLYLCNYCSAILYQPNDCGTGA